MQKKIVALAVAGLSTAAFAQTNVTIYGVVDVSGQGYSLSQSKAPSKANGGAQGNVFSMQSNASLLGFKGTEDLGNGLKGLFQIETELNMTGGSALAVNNGAFTSNLRDSFVGLNSKYGTIQGGYISTPYRAALATFDVLPGGAGSGTILTMMGSMRFGSQALGVPSTNALAYSSVTRATAIAYAMPTLYGFDASVAYTGSNNNGTNNSTAIGTTCAGDSNVSACSISPQSAFGFNLGWTGYGVNIKGAFQQANYNPIATVGTANIAQNLGDYTSYLVGAMYTGLPGLKLSAVYGRNTLGTNGLSLVSDGAAKISNNQLYAGASYRMGNWEPRVSATWNGDVAGSTVSQMGSRQWVANVGYYLSKRTQVYGLVSNLNDSANANYAQGFQYNNMKPTGGQNLFTYGLGMRTNF
jgi:predicted porin